jgi:hypothetical protein
MFYMDISMINLKAIVAFTALFLATTTTSATPFTNNVENDIYSGTVNGIPTANDENDGVPDLHDAVNNILGTSYLSNSDLDDRFVSADQFFTGNGSHSIALIGLTAGNSNTLGIYQGTTKTDVLPYTSYFGETGDGSATNPYPGSTFDVTGEFGWYLAANGPHSFDTYYSESSLNDGGWDHMMTFEIPELNGQTRFLEINQQVQEYTFGNAFLIGFEDLPYGFEQPGVLGDDDYDDMMYLVDFSPTPVSSPSMVSIMGFALLGLVRRRKKV